MAPAPKKQVIVVGGGYAGMRAVRELSSGYDVILIDPKSYWESVPAVIDCVAMASAADWALVDYPTNISRKQDLVVGITSDGTKGEATLQSGAKLPFDYAILASGSSYPLFHADPSSVGATKASRKAEFEAAQGKIAAAATVAVVGGGSVGVELAAMIKDVHRDKQVTLVAGNSMLERMSTKAQEFAATWFKEHGVEVVIGERIADWGALASSNLAEGVTLTTSQGRTIQADLAFKCIGFTPATSEYASTLSGAQLSAQGAVVVEPTLQVKDWPNVLAAGDCSSIAEEKTANAADLGAMVAARNVIALDAGKELQTYPAGLYGGFTKLPFVGGASLGRSSGIFEMGDDVQTGSMPAKMKGMIFFLYRKAIAGSRMWGWLLFGMKGMMIGQITGLAKKIAAAEAAPAVVAPAS